MFFKRRRNSDDDWHDLPDDLEESVSGRSKKGSIIPAVLLALFLVSAGSASTFWLVQRNTPVYAAKEWVEAMWTLDSETVLDRTCDQEIWVSNALASGASITGLLGYLDITQIPGLEEVVIPGVRLDDLKDEFEIDRSRIEFVEVMNDGQTAVITAQGQLRFRIFKGWYPYRLNETWLIVQEDGRWKWCGRQPET